MIPGHRIGRTASGVHALEHEVRSRSTSGAGLGLGRDAAFMNRMFNAVATAIYATDSRGRIIFYNDALEDLWGIRLKSGRQWSLRSLKLFRPDGTVLPYDRSSMALAHKAKRAIAGQEAVVERPDGTRLSFLPYSRPLKNRAGEVTAWVHTLVSVNARNLAALASQRLAAIIESSDDAILSKDTDGIITSWNAGAERLFGYSAEEVIGKSVTILIPAHLQDEEPAILRRIRRGERIDHYETVRQRKDGSLVDISLCVSPIMDSSGKVIGASKIARDISDRRRVDAQKDLLLAEMQHRMKNCFAVAVGLLTICARGATSVPELVSELQGKFQALGRASELTLRGRESASQRIADLHALIAAVTEPFRNGDGTPRVLVDGPDAKVGPRAVTNIALLLHEFATNSLKYGALVDPSGRVCIECCEAGPDFEIVWREAGAVAHQSGPNKEGFGSRLARAAAADLNGRFSRCIAGNGVEIRITLPRKKLAD